MRVLDVIDGRKFWFGVFIACLLALSVVNGINNHRQGTQNAALIRDQGTLLSYFCELTAVQDAIYVQLIAVERSALKDPTLTPQQRTRSIARLGLYRIAHDEFSNTRACQKIE